jgi:hypothetical protein
LKNGFWIKESIRNKIYSIWEIIKFDLNLIFIRVRNIIKPIIRIEASNNFIIHINMFLCMMNDDGH